MEPEAASGTSGRPRPALLVALGIAVAMLLVWWMSGKSAAPATVASNPKVAAKPGAPQPGAGDLNVRLDDLKQPRPADGAGDRNPFRFYTPPPPPPPPWQRQGRRQYRCRCRRDHRSPRDLPPPPPIPLKYIGLLEEGPGKGKIAAFSDCRTTMRGREGEIIGGQYRLVRIGLESVVLEYVDGRGRTTIRMSGQECVGK